MICAFKIDEDSDDEPEIKEPSLSDKQSDPKEPSPGVEPVVEAEVIKEIQIIEEERFDQDSETEDESEDEDDRLNVMESFGTRLQCFAHSIQLCVKSSLKKVTDANNVLNSLRVIVTFFTKSTYWRARLRESAGKDLIKPSLTRWNTYFFVLQRFLSVRK